MRLTWYDGDGLESAEDAEGAQSGQVADLDGQRRVATEDDDKVEPIPRVAQIRQSVEDQSFGHRFDNHLARINTQKHVPSF